jgi:hypothetical protein
MAENLLDKASYSVVRTNPKLTANVKVVSDGTDIYLESFSANTRLSSQKFKAFKVDGTNTYDQDVFKFFDYGKFPIEAAYEIFQEYEDTAVLSNYGNQYEMFYCAGTRSIASESYSQSLGTLAPLWLNEQIPSAFVIFRLDDPAAVNNVTATTENAGATNAQTSANFTNQVLENCTAIKTFDLTEGTSLGSYIRNYRNQEEFPKAPLNMTWRSDEPIAWNGISYKYGGFTSSGNFAYEDMVVKDSTIMQDEYLFTQGFQNNGIILANLLNLEFLFDDPTANDYSVNRYFGMYVNEIEEGQFDLSGEAFYKNTEKSQLPKITTITEVSQYLNTPFEITNEAGILLFLDPAKTTTVTGVPTPTRVDSVESVFYVKDKEDDFHTIKKGSLWAADQIRLFDTKVDVSLFTGYKEPDTFANSSIIGHEGFGQMYMKIIGQPIQNTPLPSAQAVSNVVPVPVVPGTGSQSVAAGGIININSISGTILTNTVITSNTVGAIIPEDTTVVSTGVVGSQTTISTMTLSAAVTLPDNAILIFTPPLSVEKQIEEGSKISFYDNAILTGEIFANSILAPTPGKSFEKFFNPNGTIQEVTQAITSAINTGIPENNRFFVATFNDSTVYVKSRFSGTRFNQLNFKLDIAYPEQFNQIKTYPITTLADPAKNFVGGNDVINGLLKVELTDQDRFVKGNFVQTTGGFATIGDWVPYTEEPIYDGFNQIIGYRNIDKFAIITCNNNQIMVTRSNQVALYSDYKPSFGRFSFFEVRDFDFDFYSTLYSEEGELSYETAEYNQFIPGATPVYTGVSSNPQIREFYDNGGFYNLIGLLGDSEEANPDNTFISSEYMRLEENFLTSQANISRIAPYINKWAWINDGKDVRNHPYRLDVNQAFGLNNFAPSRWDLLQEASGYSHEWYYLSEFPQYFTQNAIKSSWSYIDTAPVDNTEANLATGQAFVPGTFQNTITNNFNKYFIVEKFTTGGITEIDRQLRYGRFSGGDEMNFAETFLRGVRITARQKAIGTEKANFNIRSLSYVPDSSFNDYRFSAILVPNLPNKPESEIKFIKNEKWKTIVMLISIGYDDPCLNGPTPPGPEPIIDRTTLYSLNSSFSVDPATCAPLKVLGDYVYTDGIMRGAISLNTSSYNSITQEYTIKGMPDVNGILPEFINDIRVLQDGAYSAITFIIGGVTFVIDGIKSISSSNELICTIFTKGGVALNPPIGSPSNATLKSAIYTIANNGYLQFENRLNSVSFGEIFNAVNKGNPNIVYETISSLGTQVRNLDGTLAQTFNIELRAQSDILKSVYVGVLPDPAKPTAFNLTDVVGYDLSLRKTPNITPIARHAGYYAPYALPILFFRDPYMNIDFDVTGGVDDEAYKLKVLELCKYKNSQFNSADINFGQIQNFFYHKVNEQDPSSILELSKESAFPSLYPLIQEIGIDYKDFYAFSSNWDPSYFIKSIDKTQIEYVIGTRSMTERKSFFGSKYLKVPETIILETFKPDPFVKGAIKQPDLIAGTFMHQDTPSVTINKNIIKTTGVVNTRDIKKIQSAATIEFYLFNQKRLMEYLFTPIKAQFIKYVNELYGWGDLETLDDDVNQYIMENILKLYKVEKVDFYTLASRENVPSDYTTAELTNAQKISAGLTINNSVSSKTLNTNPFDLRLIYNKRTGFSESFGFSVTIVKK